MKVYKVKVNDKIYEVELESVSEKQGTIEAVSTSQAAPAPKAPAVTNGSGVLVKAPMQGVINKVVCPVGTKVKKGQAVLILEAMKLENEIVAPVDGVVSEISVSKGQNVNNQQPLFIIG